MQDWKIKLITKINDILFPFELYGDHKKKGYHKGLPIVTDKYDWFDLDARNSYIEVSELITKSRLSQLDLVDIFKALEGNAAHFKERNISWFMPDKIKYGQNSIEWVMQESIKFYQQTINNKRVEILELYQELKNEFIIPISNAEEFRSYDLGYTTTATEEESKKEMTFNDLFPSDADKEMVMQMLVGLKIINSEGKYLLGTKTGIIRVFIDVMKEEGYFVDIERKPILRIFTPVILGKRIEVIKEPSDFEVKKRQIFKKLMELRK